MTTKPSDAPWADEPFSLLTRPSKNPSLNIKDTSHAAVYAADTMTLIHNSLLRGLNAIIQQGPHVDAANEIDVKDYLFFVEKWTHLVQHHHDTEETVFFPELEKMSGESSLMSVSKDEHEAFHDGLMQLQQYSVKCRSTVESFCWIDMEAIIDGFATPFHHHLAEEIDLLLSLDRFDSKAVQRCWDKAEDAAKSGALKTLYDLFPLTLGCCDKTFEGGNNFPPVPRLIPYLVQYIFGRRHAGAWRFSPCGFFGHPQPLQMISKS